MQCAIFTLLVGMLWSPDAQLATSAPPQAAELALWVRQLESGDFATRELAEQNLLAAGSAALTALEAIPDRRNELGLRAHRIAEQIRQVVYLQLAKRALDGDVTAAKRLPMWDRFRPESVSDARKAMYLGKLHVAMATFGVTGKTTFANDEEAARHYNAVYRKLMTVDPPYSQREHRPGIALAKLLYGSHPQTVLQDDDGKMLRTMLSRADAGRLMRSTDDSPVMKWFATNYCENLPRLGQVHALDALLTTGIGAAAPVCCIVLEHGVSPREQAKAAAALAVVGQASDVKYLEPLFQKSTFLSGAGMSGARLNTVALLSAVLLTDQDPTSYGFRRVRVNGVYGFPLQAASLPLALRDEAFTRWEDWKKRQFDDSLPAPEKAVNGRGL